MIKQSAIWISRLIWAAAITLLVIVAVYVSLGRYYIQYVEAYQDTLVEEIVAVSGLPITIARLHGHWSQLSPVFTLEDVSLYAPDSDTRVLTANEIRIQIDPIFTLLNQTLHIRKLIINGVKCSLREQTPGHWQLEGYTVEGTGGAPDLDALVDIVLSVSAIELDSADLALRFAEGDQASVAINELSLGRRDNFRRLRLNANVDESERALLAVIEATGDPRDLQNFSARAYVKLDQLDLQDQLPAVHAFGVELQQAVVDSELWIDWQPGTEIIAQGHLSTPYLDIAGLSGEALEPLKNLQFSFRVEKTADHIWSFWVPSFSAEWQDQTLSVEQMVLEASQDSVALALPVLSIDQTVRHLLALNLMADSERQLIETLAPQGQLSNIHLTLFNPMVAASEQPGSPPRFTLRAHLDDVSIEAWHGAPGSKGISGYLEAQPLAGMVELDATDMEMSFPHVYHHSLAFNSVRGQVRWSLDEDTVRVQTGPLAVEAEFGPAAAQLTLDLPMKKDHGTPLMNLSVGIRDTDAHYRELLLPYTLDDHLLSWLEHSIPSGTIASGGFIYRGSLLHDDHDNRTVQLFFDVRDAALDFHADWPPLYDIDGMVVIDDGDVVVNADRAAMYSLDIAATHVEIKHDDAGSWLMVNANAGGSAGGVMDIVNNSVINEMVGGAFRTWSLDGHADVGIALSVPLSKDRAPEKIEVDVRLTDADLTIPDHRLQIDGVTGLIRYGHKRGLSSDRLDGTLKGKPIVATVQQQGKVVDVGIKGRVDMMDVAEWTAQPAMVFVEGETDFSAAITVAPQAGTADKNAPQSQFLLTSSLRGVAINLPAPFAKSANTQRRLVLRQPLGEPQSLLSIALENQAELQLQFDHNKLASGLLMIGKETKKQQYPGLLVVQGRVDHVNYDQWQPVVERYLQVQREFSADVIEDGTAISLAASDFRIGELEMFSQRFRDNTVDLRMQEDGLWLSVLNRTFDGELFVPSAKGQPLSILLEKLVLPEPEVRPEGEPEGEGPLAGIALDKLEPTDAYVAISDLSIGQDHLGSLAFEVLTGPGSIQLKNLGGYIRDMRIGVDRPAYLEWRITDSGATQSRFNGDIDFADLGNVLNKWNYERFIESNNGNAKFALSWPGSPDQFSLAAATGSMSLDIQKGRFLKASNTATGTLKVVSVVNLMNVVRRLRLDFSDVLNKGISFDRINGSAQLADHQLTISDVLEVKSPSSRFHLRGSADLQAAELDMELVATLPVASNLPWIAALAGGLPAAAGVYVASKIFEDQVDRFSSAVYTIKGDWNDPDMKFKRVFDDSKPGSAVQAPAGNASDTPGEEQ